jgi:hypothetical protein
MAALMGKAGSGVVMHTPTILPSLPHLPPLKGGEVVKVKGEDVYVLLLEPLADEPEAYKGVPVVRNRDALKVVPVEILLHEELIEEVVDGVSPDDLQRIRGVKRHPINDDWREISPVIWGVHVGSEFCLTEPWQRVVVCKRATILITKGADLSTLRFSRFGEASVKELPDGNLEVVLLAGAAHFSGRYEALPNGGIVRISVPVKVFVGGEEVLLEEDEDLVLYVREGEDLPEVRVVF